MSCNIDSHMTPDNYSLHPGSCMLGSFISGEQEDVRLPVSTVLIVCGVTYVC